MKKRLTNPAFILAVASLAYQVLAKYGVAPDAGTYQAAVDILSYVVIGAGIYKTFPAADNKDNVK